MQLFCLLIIRQVSHLLFGEGIEATGQLQDRLHGHALILSVDCGTGVQPAVGGGAEATVQPDERRITSMVHAVIFVC